MATNSMFRLVSGDERSRLLDLRSCVAPIYRNRLHTHFTDHSISHCDRVAKLAEALAAPLRKNKLNPSESIVLYGGCYLHDIGMHNERAGEIGRLSQSLSAAGRTWKDVLRGERLDLIRQHHHEISADMVMASFRSGSPPIGFMLKEIDFPAEIAAICEAHCVDTEAPRYNELTCKGEKSTMRLRLVSAILRLADVLDEAHHRAVVEQAETLDLNLESRMHWWRHYYTREIEIEPQKNRITIWFAFPPIKRDQYARLVPSLQVPWVERELERHRAVLAENGLSWHIDWRVHEGAFEALNEMPAEVESFMLAELSRQKQLAAQKSRVELLKHFDRSRQELLARLKLLKEKAATISAADYLTDASRLARDLWELGSRLTARDCLRSAIFFSTKNGKSVAPALHVRASIQLAEMEAADCSLRDALSALIEVREVVRSLEDTIPEKVQYFQTLSSSAFRAGYFQDGRDAAREAVRLLPVGIHRDRVEAEISEARLLEGVIDEPNPAEVRL